VFFLAESEMGLCDFGFFFFFFWELFKAALGGGVPEWKLYFLVLFGWRKRATKGEWERKKQFFFSEQ
jgi:hypothetical protein